jgi:hypothetical protein
MRSGFSPWIRALGWIVLWKKNRESTISRHCPFEANWQVAHIGVDKDFARIFTQPPRADWAGYWQIAAAACCWLGRKLTDCSRHVLTGPEIDRLQPPRAADWAGNWQISAATSWMGRKSTDCSRHVLLTGPEIDTFKPPRADWAGNWQIAAATCWLGRKLTDCTRYVLLTGPEIDKFQPPRADWPEIDRLQLLNSAVYTV